MLLLRNNFPPALASLLAACLLLAAHFARGANGAGSQAATTQSALENYTTTATGGAVFFHPPGEQAFVDEIIASYSFPIRLIDQAGFDAQMTRWKKHDLNLIAKRLGLPRPTDAMNAAFDQFSDFCKPTIEETIGEVRIYHFNDLREAASGGAKIEGITHVPENNSLNIALHIATERAGADGEKKHFRVVPVILPEPPLEPGDLVTRMRLFNGTLRDMRWRIDEAVYNAYCGRLYEITRPEIAATVSQSRFPLWLIEGMTNAIPFIVIRSHNPGLTFEQILASRTAQPPPDFKTLAAAIDLDTWALARRQPPPKPEADSYFYLSLLVTLDAIQENGEEWLPELFNRLRKENSLAFNMAVVHKIFTELTGRDLRESIARVKDRLAPKDPAGAPAGAAPQPQPVSR